MKSKAPLVTKKDGTQKKFNIPIKVGNWKALKERQKIRIRLDVEVIMITEHVLAVKTPKGEVLRLHPDIEEIMFEFLDNAPVAFNITPVGKF